MSGAPYPDGARPSNGCLLPETSFEKQRAWCSGTAPQTLVNGTAALATPLPRSAPARTPSSRPTGTGPASPLLIVLLDRTAYGARRRDEAPLECPTTWRAKTSAVRPVEVHRPHRARGPAARGLRTL